MVYLYIFFVISGRAREAVDARYIFVFQKQENKLPPEFSQVRKNWKTLDLRKESLKHDKTTYRLFECLF